MWFWLSAEAERTPGLGIIGGRRSRFFSQPSARQAVTLAIDRSSEGLRRFLPPDYVVDESQAFEPARASQLASGTGVESIIAMTGESFARLTREISAMIRNNTGVTVEIRAVPDAQLIDRLTSDEAAGDPADFVVGDDALARQLTQLGFTNTQLIRI